MKRGGERNKKTGLALLGKVVYNLDIHHLRNVYVILIIPRVFAPYITFYDRVRQSR